MALGLLAVVLALTVSAVLLPPGRALAVVLATLVLVPGTLPFPGGPGILTIHRVVVLAALLGLVRRCAVRELPWTVLRPPPVAYRLALLLGVLAVLGVALLQPTTDPGAASRSWEAFVAQLVVLVVVLALVRAAGTLGAGALPLAVAVAVSAAIGVIEHLTQNSYARVWYRLVPSLLTSDPAQVLATRGGHVRVRAAADFTLAFAWGTAACLPLLLAVATLHRGRVRRVLLLSAPVVVLALVWAYSRSVVLPAAIAVVGLAAVSRDRRVQVLTAVALGLGGLLVLDSPNLQRDFSVAVDTGSIDVRLARLPAVAQVAASHPFRGVGLSGLSSLGIPTTDSTYLLGYAEVGAIGVAVLGAVLLAGFGSAGRAVLSGDHAERLLAMAFGGGALLLIVGAVSFDAFTTASTAELFWVLVAFGIALAERSVVMRRRPALKPDARVLGVAALLGLGLLLRTTASSHVAQEWQFETLTPAVNTAGAPTYTGVQLRTSACRLLDERLQRRPGLAVDCRAAPDDAPGQTLLRLEAPNSYTLRELTLEAVSAIRSVPGLEQVALVSRGPEVRGRPSGLRTAPASLLAFGLVLLLPVPGRRP
ncbi:MAG: hypothetical protein QOG99_3396 [Frankiales bacterium]|jgi:hypothetical protein|nr:hypothetical protein [Frankiales bacterium]